MKASGEDSCTPLSIAEFARQAIGKMNLGKTLGVFPKGRSFLRLDGLGNGQGVAVIEGAPTQSEQLARA